MNKFNTNKGGFMKFFLLLIFFSFSIFADDNFSLNPYYAQSGDESEYNKIFDDIQWKYPGLSQYEFAIYAGEILALSFIYDQDLQNHLNKMNNIEIKENIENYLSDEQIYYVLNSLYSESINCYNFDDEIKNMIYLIAMKNISFFLEAFKK